MRLEVVVAVPTVLGERPRELQELIERRRRLSPSYAARCRDAERNGIRVKS